MSTSNSSTVFFYLCSATILVLFSSSLDRFSQGAMPRCPPCPGGDCPEPTEGSCHYGIVTNYCGRRVCAKGPGQVCGTGMFKMLGTCGDGLYCNCGKCIGCYDFECYDKTCTK